MTFLETLSAGEYVMIDLAAILVIAIIIWIARACALSSLQKKNVAMMHRIRDYIVEGDIENAKELCESQQTPGAAVILAGLSRVGRQMGEISDAVNSALNIQNAELEKGKRWLQAIAIMSPLIGLGGSLAGICDRLEVLADAGAMADIAMLSAEIAPTIVTTIAGLIVGVAAIFIYFCLDGEIDKAKNRLARLGSDFQNLLNEPS